jgi:integrase
LRKSLANAGVHIHSLRHTYAYLLKTSRVHVTTAQKLMGHSDPKITLGIYTRFRDDEIDEAGRLMQAVLAS